jgi:hypothetical protein
MVKRIFDAAYVRIVFNQLEAHVRVAGLTSTTREEAEREAIYCWMSGIPAGRAAALIGGKIAAG